MRVEVNHLSFSYGRTPVLRDISFSVPEGALVAVLGPNGVGKSTLFRCLMGFLHAEGEILLDGAPLSSLSRRELARREAYIPQSAEPTFSYTVLDAVLMGTTGGLPLLAVPGKTERAQALDALRRLGIEALAERCIDRISGGERQLVLLARALVQQAKLLVMDEPTANLDYGNRQRVLQGIASLTAQGYTVLLSTHDPDQALRCATHVLALKDGKLAAWGRTEDVLTAELIEELYRFPVRIVETATEHGPVKSCVPLGSGDRNGW